MDRLSLTFFPLTTDVLWYSHSDYFKMNASAASELLLTSAREGVDHIKARELLYQPTSTYQQDFDADVIVTTQGESLMQLLQQQAHQQQIEQEKRRLFMRQRLQEIMLAEASTDKQGNVSSSETNPNPNLSRDSISPVPPPPPANSSPTSVASISASCTSLRRDSLQAYMNSNNINSQDKPHGPLQGNQDALSSEHQFNPSKNDDVSGNNGATSISTHGVFGVGSGAANMIPWWIIQ